MAHARRVAAAKAEAARSTEPMAVEEVILAADTEVWRPPDGAPLGKPRDRAHAESVLRMLTEGPPHCVSTAWVLAPHRMAPELHDETTRVWMRPIDTAELADYLDTDEWCDKAGGYGIQGRAGAFVTRIDGSYSNVVGLPLAQVIERLRALQEGTRR